DLFELAFKRHLLIVPVSTTADVADSPQLAERSYWTPVEHPEAGRTRLYPGPFAKFSASPIRYGRRAPRVGEDDAAVTERPRPPVTPTNSSGDLPLPRVKVRDFI